MNECLAKYVHLILVLVAISECLAGIGELTNRTTSAVEVALKLDGFEIISCQVDGKIRIIVYRISKSILTTYTHF